ncbi:histidine--tRNA ligase [Nanoarchaeota archaeon]
MDTVKGFRDFIGKEALKREQIKQLLVKTFKSYGFEPAETPVIEQEAFVRGDNPQDEAVSDTFKLQDRGKRNLALRYEFTFQLKRISKNKKLPYKRFQIGPVFRDEPATANRLRQFIQCDVDIVGSTIKEEAEILAIEYFMLKKLGINATINVNNRKLLNEILDKGGIKQKDKEKVIREIDKLDKISEKDVKANLKKYNAEKILPIFKKPESYFKRYEAFKEIEELKKYCNCYGVKFTFLPSLARGLSYYTGSIFEVKTKEMRETISAGGSYLINGLQSTGIAFGLDRISQLAKIKPEEKRILIISIGEDKESIKLAEKLRKEDIQCMIMYKKISKALDYANINSFPYVIFLGKDEVKKKKVKLRDMKTGKEKMISISNISKNLLL